MTKEQFHYWCEANMLLSRKDRRFMSHVSTLLSNSEPLTTAQASLWLDIVTKNQRQVRRAFSDDQATALKKADWAVEPVRTVRINKISLVFINDEPFISVKIPFSKELNSQLQLMQLDFAVKFNNLHHWHFKYSARSLRTVTTLLKKKQIEYAVCPTLADVLEQTRLYGRQRHWTPMVHDVGGRWYVSNLRETMLPHLPDPADTTVAAALKYTQLGISLSPVIRRRLNREHGSLIGAMINSQTLAINRCVAAANECLCRYIAIARPTKVLLLSCRRPNNSASESAEDGLNTPLSSEEMFDQIAAVCKKLNIPVTVATYAGSHTVHTFNHDPGDAPCRTDDSGLIITDLASRVREIRSQCTAKIIAAVQDSVRSTKYWNL